MLDFASPIRQRFCLLKPASRAYALKTYRRFIDASDIGYWLLTFAGASYSYAVSGAAAGKISSSSRDRRSRGWCGLLCGRRGWVDELATRALSVSVLVSLVVVGQDEEKDTTAPSSLPLPIAGEVVWASLLEEEDTNSILHLLLLRRFFPFEGAAAAAPPCSAPLISVYDVNY